ncbi:MAG: TonB-dependent receptor plug domain-containing protein, partial [Verrucomicrobiota bacterium]
DKGFAAANAGTATRLTLDMRDVPAAFSMMTRDFIDELGVVNVGEAASWMPNGASVEPQDNVQQPMQYSTRGVNNNSGQQRNNYLTNGLLESYAIERYEFGRGPNAALFNIGAGSSLAGGLGAQTKKARYDRPFDTIAVSYGSWDYKRTTVDVNRPLTDKLAVRGNAVWFDKGGWRMAQWEKTHGVTAGAAYLVKPKTELRIEGAYDSTKRNNDTNSIFDSLSGWDGATVFRGPITNAILGSQTTPGVPNSFGQVLTFQGERQGVNRRGANYYVWDPFSGQNLIMNYQNEAMTRRADETANTPILANGVLYIRSLTPAGAAALPYGNGSGALSPTINQNPGASAQLLYSNALPPDLYARAINGSAFRLPSKRFTGAGFDSAAYTQTTKDVNLSVSHQIGDRWFFEVGADVNKVETVTARDAATTVRTVRIDINQLLPNGAANPHFLQTYGDAPLAHTDRNFLNRGVRGNAAYKHNAGKWGDYTFNLNVSSSLRTTENRTLRFSLADMTDPRMWQATADQVNIRQYWVNPSRPYGDAGVPTTLSRNVFAADGNSFTTATQTITPRWVPAGWNDTDERFDNAVLAMSAKYLGGKVVLLGATRLFAASFFLSSLMNLGLAQWFFRGFDHDAQVEQLLHQFGLHHGAIGLLVQAPHHRLWHARRSEKAVPAGRPVVTGQALADGGHLGHAREALAGVDGQHLDLARLDLRREGADDAVEQLDLPCEQIGERRAAGLVGHMQHLHAGQLFDHHAREVVGGAYAGAAIGKPARIALGVHDGIGHGIEAQCRIGHHAGNRFAEQDDRRKIPGRFVRRVPGDEFA